MPHTKQMRLSIFEISLRQRGLKPTAQRRAVAEQALTEQRHFSAEELCDELQRSEGRNVSRASVYRTLQFLEETKLVRTVDAGHDSKVYERSPLNDTEEHAHLICTECGAIQDVDLPTLPADASAAAEGFGFLVASHSVSIFGTCAACA